MHYPASHDQPKRLNRGQLLVGALVFLTVTLACAVSSPDLPGVRRVPTPEAPLGLIAYVGNDGNIYTTDRDGKKPTPLTQDAVLRPSAGQTARIYLYPTWAPDGQRLAFVSFTAGQSGPEASLVTSLSDGKKRVQAFTSQDTLPFYLFWSPDSRSVTFLGNNAAGELVQYLVAASGGESKFIGTGQPYYWDWSPDNRTLIVHTGGSSSDNPEANLAFFTLDGSIQRKQLDLKPGKFQAPAWSPVGDVFALLAQNDAGQEELVLAGRDGKLDRVLAQVSGPAAFAWSPEGKRLAYTSIVQLDAGQVIRLALIDPTHPDQGKEISRGNLLAFFWSPDGQKIAYFVLGGSSGSVSQVALRSAGDPSLVLRVYDLTSGKTLQVASFTPTDSFKQFIPFYDQYQRSGTVWSPDSQNLVVAGVGSDGNDGIYVVHADGSNYHKIADGDLAFWAGK